MTRRTWTSRKSKHSGAAVRYLYVDCGHKNYIAKPRVKVFIHNGTTVYESANNRSAWEKRFARYIDSINTDITKRTPTQGERKCLNS